MRLSSRALVTAIPADHAGRPKTALTPHDAAGHRVWPGNAVRPAHRVSRRGRHALPVRRRGGAARAVDQRVRRPAAHPGAAPPLGSQRSPGRGQPAGQRAGHGDRADRPGAVGRARRLGLVPADQPGTADRRPERCGDARRAGADRAGRAARRRRRPGPRAARGAGRHRGTPYPGGGAVHRRDRAGRRAGGRPGRPHRRHGPRRARGRPGRPGRGHRRAVRDPGVLVRVAGRRPGGPLAGRRHPGHPAGRRDLWAGPRLRRRHAGHRDGHRAHRRGHRRRDPGPAPARTPTPRWPPGRPGTRAARCATRPPVPG